MSLITLIIGAPGTGKTYRIRKLKEKLPNAIIFCPTNSSAELCGGQTVFKWFGCTPFTLQDTPTKRFPKGQVVIFDEIFMFPANIFDKVLEAKPFKVICFGDPFQIHQSNQSYWYENVDIDTIEVKHLTKYYRAEDPILQRLLTDYRETKQIPSILPFEKIDQKLIQQYVKNGWTLLVGKKQAVVYYSRNFRYDFRDASGTWWYHNQSVMTINQYGNCREITRIKDFKNNIFYLENGEEVRPKKRGNKTNYLIQRADIMTVNLAQGQTLDGVLIDFASFFEFGSAYTAISRVKSAEKIKLVSYPIEIMEADLSNEFIYV